MSYPGFYIADGVTLPNWRRAWLDFMGAIHEINVPGGRYIMTEAQYNKYLTMVALEAAPPLPIVGTPAYDEYMNNKGPGGSATTPGSTKYPSPLNQGTSWNSNLGIIVLVIGGALILKKFI